MKLAMMNHTIARKPIRPTAALSPICASPETIVASTSGATSILIRLRKMVDNTWKLRAQVSVVAMPESSPALTIQPTTTPSASPIMMQRVRCTLNTWSSQPRIDRRSAMVSALRRICNNLAGDGNARRGVVNQPASAATAIRA